MAILHLLDTESRDKINVVFATLLNRMHTIPWQVIHRSMMRCLALVPSMTLSSYGMRLFSWLNCFVMVCMMDRIAVGKTTWKKTNKGGHQCHINQICSLCTRSIFDASSGVTLSLWAKQEKCIAHNLLPKPQLLTPFVPRQALKHSVLLLFAYFCHTSFHFLFLLFFGL